ncbi:protease SohB [Coxiella endosymbiont of Amblyomma americanum]|uniref:protease SohB n=1 Tax=Coxiella endosymbiont of Amblyomma americanum TaxID=325775 RepID=UPI0005800DAB|nr:protease SohB [Coxiella endosymbiont of Amblyomma americanum]AJC50478.1 peptidase S49 [Coxiella endosymbiont of Amblyomma americanum]AUJ58818.1 protease SohB [Coxiella-like endosymbiont of Amblyomma americanum]
MEFFINYGLFLAKLISTLAIILIALFALLNMFAHAKGKVKGQLEIQKLNEKYAEYNRTLSRVVKNKHEFKLQLKSQKKDYKQKKKLKEQSVKRIFVLNFHGDVHASSVEALRTEVTALLTLANNQDEVFLRLESGGGTVHHYGLATSQLQRIKAANIKLLVSVDKIAASGGYLMASVADCIIAAPFAIIGSIGVLAQLPNFHRFLQKKSIDFEQIAAGEYKRTLTLFGENTEQGRAKIRQEVEETHEIFKNFIKEHRKSVDIEKISTGEHWYASQAFHLKLIDKLITSDDYLFNASRTCDLYEINYRTKYSLGKRLAYSFRQACYQICSGTFIK